MIYTYRVSGNDGDDQDGWIEIDTADPEFKRRVAWLSDMAGLPLPIIKSYLNRAPLTAGGNVASGESLTVWGQAEWTKDGRSSGVDVRVIGDADDTAVNLPASLTFLNIDLGLGITDEAIRHMRYAPPEPPQSVEDWQAPDSPMAEPMPGLPAGRYSSRGKGRKQGDIWTGPSGSRYQLKNIGGLLSYLAWVRL